MKLVKVFALFVLLHAVGWAFAHVWMNSHEKRVLLVVDTSYAMKPKFPAVQRWIENYHSSVRYTTVIVGTDKVEIGNLDDIKSIESIFRTAFGKINNDSLKRYQTFDADDRILLSDGALSPADWDVVEF